jgi:hypothetical protein
VSIGGNAWEANTGAANFTINGTAMSNQWMTLSPSADAATETMLKTWREHWAFDARMSSVPSGTYTVYIYVVQSWTNPDAPTVTFSIEGQSVGTHTPGAGGTWARLGPFTTSVTDGTLNITANGTTSISGIEVHRAP